MVFVWRLVYNTKVHTAKIGKKTKAYKLVQDNRRKSLPDHSPRRFFESDREILQTSRMSP